MSRLRILALVLLGCGHVAPLPPPVPVPTTTASPSCAATMPVPTPEAVCSGATTKDGLQCVRCAVKTGCYYADAAVWCVAVCSGRCLPMMRWLTPELRAKLQRHCDEQSVPLGLAVGWICVESGGNPASTTSLREYGLFQILPAESADLGFDHERIRTDADYGIECGFALIYYYRKTVTRLLDGMGLPSTFTVRTPCGNL